MTTTTMPEWKRKLMDIWDRRNTAGFYELDELMEEIKKQQHEHTLEMVEKEVISLAFGQGNIPEGWDVNSHVSHEAALGNVLARIADLRDKIKEL